MNKRLFGAVAFMLLAVAAGALVARNSWSGLIYISDGNLSGTSARNPAAIRPDLDFSGLVGAELVHATQKRLVSAARVILQGEDVGIELGAFVTRGESGKRQHVCQFYDRISMRFEAEGIADSGEKPEMEIEGSCNTSKDISRIEPIWIPIQRITQQPPANMDLSFDDGANFKFTNMGTEWPSYWRLQSVRLFGEAESSHEVSITGEELREILKRPLIVSWRVDDFRLPAGKTD